MRSSRVKTALIAALGPGLAAACGRHASAADCSALLDRYVELLVREQTPSADDAEIAAQQRATREKAAHDSSFASCPNEVRASAVRCAMSAPSVDEFEKCIE
jgi:hypothetical protein